MVSVFLAHERCSGLFQQEENYAVKGISNLFMNKAHKG